MNKRNAKILWWAVLVLEAVMLIAMLLCDFGVLSTNINPLSFQGLVYHAIAVALIIAAVNNLKRL